MVYIGFAEELAWVEMGSSEQGGHLEPKKGNDKIEKKRIIVNDPRSSQWGVHLESPNGASQSSGLVGFTFSDEQLEYQKNYIHMIKFDTFNGRRSLIGVLRRLLL